MKTYSSKEAVVFYKTREKWGELSNMCAGFPLKLGDIEILTSEALYQALKFKDKTIQGEILTQKSPMAAKMVASREKQAWRKDWESIKVGVMVFCLELKVKQHWEKLTTILEETNDKTIVEKSTKDQFWGCKIFGEEYVGHNILGRIWEKIREKIQAESMKEKDPIAIPPIEDLTLMGQRITDLLV